MAKDTKHYFKSGETLWNHRRDTSDWHFDPTVKGEPNNLVNTEFLKFRGDWSEELKNTKYAEKAPLDIKNYLVRLGVQLQRTILISMVQSVNVHHFLMYTVVYIKQLLLSFIGSK